MSFLGLSRSRRCPGDALAAHPDLITRSRGRAPHARSATTTSPRRSAKRWRRDPKVQPIGAFRLWRRRRGMRRRRSIASGAHSGCNRNVRRHSSSCQTRCSSRRCGTSSASISRRRNARSCCASMRRAKYRRSIEPSLSCRCDLARLSGARTL